MMKGSVMRGASVEGFVGRPTGVLVVAALALAPGCKSTFTGPYKCADGYASCVNPSQNACETDTTTDGLHCGGCGATCPVGAPCVDSSCGQAAVRIAVTGSSALVRTNATTLFWSPNNQSNTVFRLPLSAAAGTSGITVVNDGANLGNGRTTFAVDDTNIYYLAGIQGGSGSCPPGPGCVNLAQMPLAGGATTTLIPWSALSALLSTAGILAGSGNGSLQASLAVNGSNVFFLVSFQSNNVVTYAVGDAMIGGAGQAGRLLAQTTSNNGFSSGDLVANATVVAFDNWDGGATWLHVIPADGSGSGSGTMRTIQLPGGFVGPLAADESNAYVVASGCGCSDNQSTQGPPPGAVTKVPLAGGPAQMLTRMWGATGAIAVDTTNVYWSTDTTAWKAPIAGGTATPIAGNLGNGVPPYQCNGCGGGSMPQGGSIAVAPSAVYLFAGGTEQAILKVTK